MLYRAIKNHQVDLIVGSSTDGLIQALDLVVLEDDRTTFRLMTRFPLFAQQTIQQFPMVKTALEELAGKISQEEMQRMNYAVDGEHRDAAAVAADFLKSKGLIH